jgi:hypothetical protein
MMTGNSSSNGSLERELREKIGYDPCSGQMTSASGQVVRRTPSNRYMFVRVCGVKILAHRAAWFLYYGVWPEGQIDHINGDKTDNRIENLRDVDQCKNRWNQPAKRNESGLPFGVKRKGTRFEARLRQSGRYIHLGSFPNPELAGAAVQDAIARLRGEFAWQGSATSKSSRASFGTERVGGIPSGKSQASLTAGASAPALSGE